MSAYEALCDYLRSERASSYYVSGSEVHRAVNVPHGQWTWLLDDGAGRLAGSEERDTAFPLTGSVGDGVRRALERVVERGDCVDASALAEAAKAAKADDPTSLVECWFTVMAWGAGPRPNARLRQWTRALHDGVRLEATLSRTLDLVEQGELATAYRAAPLPGVGSSFFTKWLWVVSSVRDVPKGYIFDSRVSQTLRLLGWRADGANAAARWVAYNRTMEEWAGRINEHAGWAATPEHVEQMLFHRKLSGPDQTLIDYLRNR